MLTKYYLNGGNSSADSPANLEFKQTIISEIQDNPKMVFCYFGKPAKDWEVKFAEDKQSFLGIDSKLDIQLASEENFEELYKEAGLIFLSGGDAFILMDKLSRFDLKSLFAGKVVAATSAGPCVLSKYFYSNDESRVSEGLGILNIKVHCHYAPEKQPNIEKLKAHGKDLEIIALPEQKYVRMFQ